MKVGAVSVSVVMDETELSELKDKIQELCAATEQYDDDIAELVELVDSAERTLNTVLGIHELIEEIRAMEISFNIEPKFTPTNGGEQNAKT